jgi:hypothetical protein
VDLWLSENESPVSGSGWRAGESPVPSETLVGVAFGLWGTILLMLFALDLPMGGFLALIFPGIRTWWGASLVLAAAGAWLAFELSNSEGIDVAREPVSSPV